MDQNILNLSSFSFFFLCFSLLMLLLLLLYCTHIVAVLLSYLANIFIANNNNDAGSDAIWIAKIRKWDSGTV